MSRHKRPRTNLSNFTWRPLRQGATQGRHRGHPVGGHTPRPTAPGARVKEHKHLIFMHTIQAEFVDLIIWCLGLLQNSFSGQQLHNELKTFPLEAAGKTQTTGNQWKCPERREDVLWCSCGCWGVLGPGWQQSGAWGEERRAAAPLPSHGPRLDRGT